MTARILVWGAGAIGGIVGACLARAGHDVTLVDIMEDHVAPIRDPARGLRITGPIAEFTQTIPAFTPATLRGVWDTVLLAVKAQDTPGAVTALLAHLAPAGRGVIVALQNGLIAETVAAIAGAERVVAASINFAGDWLSPGEIRFAARGALTLGMLDGSHPPRLDSLLILLRDFEPQAEITGDIRAWLWGELGFAAMLITQAAGESSIVDCFSRPELVPLWRRLGSEMAAVSACAGVHPHAFDAFDPRAFTDDAPLCATRSALTRLIDTTRRGAKTHSGIWRDLAIRRRRAETSVQLGAVVVIGRGQAVPTPTLERLIAMIEQIERGERRQDDRNLPELLAV